MSNQDSRIDGIVDIMLHESPRDIPAKPARETVDLEARFIEKARGMDSFKDVEFRKGENKVVWEWSGEGADGDYDEENVLDYPHLRFSCLKQHKDCDDVDSGDWVEIPDSSYCTRLPISTPHWMLKKAAKEILEALLDVSYKNKLEDLSWFCVKDFSNGSLALRDKKFNVTVFSQAPDDDTKIECKIESVNGILFISPKGYGDYASEDGYGTPIAVEIWDGHLRVLVWDDINKEDPRILDLEGAKESLRKEGQIP
jgi:hypothetical protein